MDGVKSIDTSGVCWLLRVVKLFRDAGGRFVLYAVPGIVLHVLDVLRLTPMLPLAADEAAAREKALQVEGPRIERFPSRDPGPSDRSLRQPG